MNKLVMTAFKAIAYSIIFVVIFSVVFYLYRVYSLNQRIEALMVTMQQEVSKNNYLPEDTYEMYEGMLINIADTMNGANKGSFIRGYNINYRRDCDFVPPAGSSLHYSKRLDTPADYGDVAIIELTVTINAVNWFYDPNADGSANSVQINETGEGGRGSITMTYTYQVPCLRYISVTN